MMKLHIESSSAFSGCKKPKNIRLPESVKKIFNSVFANCENLEELEPPISLEVLDLSAIKNCIKLKQLIIPESVTYLYGYSREGYVFEGWSKNVDCFSIDYTVKYYPERRVYGLGRFYHDYTEIYYTESPFHEKNYIEPNEYYDSEVTTLYAVWRKI